MVFNWIKSDQFKPYRVSLSISRKPNYLLQERAKHMTFKEQYNQAKTRDEQVKIVYHLMLSIKNKEHLNNISTDLLIYFVNQYVDNKLMDANGKLIRNIRSFLIKVNENKMPTQEWYEKVYSKKYGGWYMEQDTNQAKQTKYGQGRINDYFMSLTQDERTELAKKGGKASGKKRQARKTLQEDLLFLLTQPIPKKDKEQFNINGKTWQDGVLYGALLSACKGNIRALETIVALIGEKPKEQLVITTQEQDGFIQALEQLLKTNEQDKIC